MKLAIISDMHFGDDNCVLVVVNPATNQLVKGPKYDAFLQAAGTDNDYLVLAGDVLDFSIASYEEGYRYAKFFFEQIRRDKVAKEIIYLAGNHDADIWHIVQHQRAVINRVKRGLLPKAFQHSVAGIIDDRAVGAGPRKGFTLDRVAKNAEGPQYGHMFLDHITTPDTVFNFVYPNLYIATDNEVVLVTHGQYLEAYWALLGEVVMKVAYDDLKIGAVDIEEMMEMNFPLNQLACTGLGQAGVLTKVVRQVELDVKNGDLHRVEKYLNRLEKEIDSLTNYGWIKELVVDYLVKKAKEGLLDSLKTAEHTRFSEEFIHKKEVRERFKNFYDASLLEIGDINARTNANLPAPWRVIFGHTHQPIPWNDPDAPKLDSVSSAKPRCLTLHNAGGWLMEDGKFCGAEVFCYETGKGFSSQTIS